MGKQPIDDSIIIRGNQVKGLRFLMGIVSESIPKQRDQSAVVSIRRVRVDDTKPGAWLKILRNPAVKKSSWDLRRQLSDGDRNRFDASRWEGR